MKSKKKKIIIGIIIALIVGIILYGIYVFGVIFMGIGKTVDKVRDKINDYQENVEEREDTYNGIVDELESNKLITNDWRFVSKDYGWSGEWIDRSDQYYFYIDDEKYEKYKHYWLEGVNTAKYRDNYNRDLYEFGDYVFHAINISDLSYENDIDYANVHLTKNKTYYLVQIYDNSIYYKYIYNYKDDGSYLTGSNFQLDGDSLSSEYIFYKENNKWIIEKLIRE